MLGSAVECLLLLFTDIFFDEALKTEEVPRYRNRKIKHLLEWKLADLLRVAKAANWFPETIQGKKAAIRDSADTLKRIRNLVHPAAYLRDHHGRRVTKKALDFSFETALDARDWLLDRINTDLARRLEEEEPDKPTDTGD